MPLKGEKMTDEEKANWLAKMAAVRATPEYHAKLSKPRGPCTEERRAKISAAKKGKPNGLTGHKWTAESRRKASASAKARGETHNFRVDGKGHERRTERRVAMNAVEYRLWREAVFARDNHTCQACGQRGGVYLIADHIHPWKTHPELRYDVENGRTLCDPCHRVTPTFGTRLLRCERSEPRGKT